MACSAPTEHLSNNTRLTYNKSSCCDLTVNTWSTCPSPLTMVPVSAAKPVTFRSHTPSAFLCLYFSPSPVFQFSLPPSLFRLLLSLFSSVDSVSAQSVVGEERQLSRVLKRRRGLEEERLGRFIWLWIKARRQLYNSLILTESKWCLQPSSQPVKPIPKHIKFTRTHLYMHMQIVQRL